MKIIKIGRSSSNDVNIQDPQVSRVHCQIIQDDNGNFRLIDTNSRNGTFINGIMRHGEVPLNKTDIIRIGNSTLPWQSYFSNSGDDTTGGGSNHTMASYPPPIYSYPSPEPPKRKPNNYLAWAILTTIFCCLPFGIVSIVYASKVDRLWYAGEYDEAYDAASSAKAWFWWSFATGIITDIIVIFLNFIPFL